MRKPSTVFVRYWRTGKCTGVVKCRRRCHNPSHLRTTTSFTTSSTPPNMSLPHLTAPYLVAHPRFSPLLLHTRRWALKSGRVMRLGVASTGGPLKDWTFRRVPLEDSRDSDRLVVLGRRASVGEGCEAFQRQDRTILRCRSSSTLCRFPSASYRTTATARRPHSTTSSLYLSLVELTKVDAACVML